jgi:peptidoglycan/LPS O-acetylase OafA/YrhL
MAVLGVYHCAFNGPAAVLVFFLISGLCIHLPYRGADSVNLSEFYTRRLVRISLPLFASIIFAFGYASIFDSQLVSQALNVVTWSIYCEIAYYLVYPLLFIAWRKIGWNGLLAISLVPALAMLALHYDYNWYWQFGFFPTIVICLPFWLLGCQLSLGISGSDGARRPMIWLWRLAAFTYTAACIGVANLHSLHSPVGLAVMLYPFGLLAYFWLLREISLYSTRQPWRILEWGGTWSYSLYLVHGPILGIFYRSHNTMLTWPLLCFSLLLISYLFFLAVEQPAHRLSRSLAKRARAIPWQVTAPRGGARMGRRSAYGPLTITSPGRLLLSRKFLDLRREGPLEVALAPPPRIM